MAFAPAAPDTVSHTNTSTASAAPLDLGRLDSIDDVLLMGPGPSSVPPEVYRALASQTLGHLDPDFVAIMDEIKADLATVFGADPTQGGMSMPMSGTGSAGMETVFVNLLQPGDRVLVLINGVFGARMKDVAERLGAHVDTLEYDWGTPVVPADLQARLHGEGGQDYKIVAVVHAETSTGVANPIPELAEILRDHPALFIVDCVTSLAGMPVKCAEWGVDAAYSGTQKCLSCPPGLAPLTFSQRAVQVIMERDRKVPNWYLDVTMLVNYWTGAKRVYHHTAPINMLYGLYAALKLVLREGLDAVYARHRAAHDLLADGLRELGLELFVHPDFRLPMLNAVTIPDGVQDEAAVRTRLRRDFHIEIGPGLGPLAGKIWRIGLMGHTARPENVQRVLDALRQSLAR